MTISTSVTINATKERVWKLMTDIENSHNVIEAINALEVLEKPESGLVGFKWKETSTMIGKEATEVMWVTDVQEMQSYTVRAESHGAIYTTVMSMQGEDGAVELAWEFGAEVVSTGAKIMWFLTGWMMKGSTKKALTKDLEDIKRVAEQS